MIREVFTCDLCKMDKPKDDLYRRVEVKDKYNYSTFKYRPSHSPEWGNGTQTLICKGCVKEIKETIA